MAQYVRAIKSRIGNIEDIAQITRAMNAIAMTKVTRMKKRLVQARPYAADLETVTRKILGHPGSGADEHPLVVDRGSGPTAVLVLNADRGMCGRYKGEMNRAAEAAVRAAGPDGQLLAGGEKARTYFERRGVTPLRIYAHVYDPPSFAVARRVADEAMAMVVQGDVRRVRLVYMKFLSDLSQRLVVEDLLPVRLDPQPADFLVEPNPRAILEETVSLYVQVKLYVAMLETKTSEDAIRRQAMKSATDNAEDLLKTLTRSYNRARQQSITREIADIIGGAEALRTE